MREFFRSKVGKWILRGVGLLLGGALTALGKDLYDSSKAKYHAHVIAEAQESKLNKDSTAALLAYLMAHANTEDSLRIQWREKHVAQKHPVKLTSGPKNFYDYKRAMNLMQTQQ